jgi:5'(3')-deoxyribonucleotidase
MIILIDLDGVLANFNAGAISAAGLPIRSEDVDSWDFFLPYMSEEEFTKAIDDTMYFWDDLEVYPWAHRLVEVCRAKGEVFFCSSPGNHDEAATGKLNWLRKNGFLGPKDKNYVLTHDKWLLAGPGRVLVDDSPFQLTKFRDAGGERCTFPQPWNHTGGYTDKVGYVENFLKHV